MSLLDWDNPPTIGTRKRATRDLDLLSRAKLKRAKGPKNHSTNKERSAEARAKAARQAKLKERRSEKRKAFLDAVRAYWRGEGDHP